MKIFFVILFKVQIAALLSTLVSGVAFWGHIFLEFSKKPQESGQLGYNLFWFPVPFIEYSVPFVTMKMDIHLHRNQKEKYEYYNELEVNRPE